MKSERGIITTARRRAKNKGWWSCKNHGSAASMAGLPDVTFVKDGVTVWIEFKVPGKRPTIKQFATMARLKEYGAFAIWVDGADECLDALEAIHEMATTGETVSAKV